MAVDRRRDYIRLKHRDSRIAGTWDRRLHDCWWYDPATDHPVDLAEPSAADPDWVAASESLIAAARSVERVAAPELPGQSVLDQVIAATAQPQNGPVSPA